MTARKPKPAIPTNTIEFETQILVKPTGFREYDARWYFGLPGDEKASELNLYGVQALAKALACSCMSAACRLKSRSVMIFVITHWVLNKP